MKRILIIDKNEAVRISLKQQLEKGQSRRSTRHLKFKVRTTLNTFAPALLEKCYE